MRSAIINIILWAFLLPTASAQLGEDVVKANFILNMAKFVEWAGEDSIAKYRVGVLGADEIFEALKSRSREDLFKGKEFDVIQFKRVNQVGDVHMLYVEQRKNHALGRILKMAKARQILVFSDSCSTLDDVMINLLGLNVPGNQFEINKSNINEANLQVSPKLLYHGGSEEDLREMYQASERELSSVQEELAEQKSALQQQREELETKQREILSLNKEIALQEEHLRSMVAEAKAKRDSLDLKIALLDAQQVKIKKQQADIEAQSSQLLRQKQEIKAGNEFLARQKQEIDNQEQRIREHQEELQEQAQTLSYQSREIETQGMRIEKQQAILYLFIALFALIAAMVFFILRAYQIKRRANKKLEEKNAAISRQKDEIESQREQLRVTNQKIERQNENIKSSIHYALTIQQALLPPPKEMDKHFESFVLYRPKDIVSGDFYWMSKAAPEQGAHEKIFVVVADCTGHGVPGAFLSMIGIKLLTSIVNERKEHSPRRILEILDNAVQEALQQKRKVSDDGMDVCLCRIERTAEDKIKVVYSGARRPLYYSKGQQLEVLRGDRKTVGGRFLKSQVFTNRELWLAPGDRLFLTSDGMADQNAPNREKFGSRRLIQVLEDSLHLPLDAQKEVLEKTLDDFQQGQKQRDDISLMAIKL